MEGRFISKDPIAILGNNYNNSYNISFNQYVESITNGYMYVDSVGKPQTNLYSYTDSNPVNNTDPLGLFTVSQVPGMLKAGAGQLMDNLPQMAFGTVLGRLLNGPTSVLGFFASPDTFASPLQEDMRYRNLFPNMYGYPNNSAASLGLVCQ